VRETLEFDDLLRLIDERAAAFRSGLAAAPDLGVPVPSCPGWTLLDLAEHLGQGRRKWAAIITAGPAEAPPAITPEAAPREREALLAWLTESFRLMLHALRAAGPDAGCWTWWPTSQSPQTSGAVARHQLQEAAVHTYDAQLAVGAPQPLPEDIALDGIEDFLFTCVATTEAWPHASAAVDYQATEGRSWRLRLDGDGAWADRLIDPAPTDAAYASVLGPASELVLLLYGRLPVSALKADGDLRVLDQLIAWEPE
jgi:uncharacterized protein (TIGR03083 family)